MTYGISKEGFKRISVDLTEDFDSIDNMSEKEFTKYVQDMANATGQSVDMVLQFLLNDPE
jgi:hypothetical protein